jgi:hypothetical protein
LGVLGFAWFGPRLGKHLIEMKNQYMGKMKWAWFWRKMNDGIE